jgi:hypothetical protein
MAATKMVKQTATTALTTKYQHAYSDTERAAISLFWRFVVLAIAAAIRFRIEPIRAI